MSVFATQEATIAPCDDPLTGAECEVVTSTRRPAALQAANACCMAGIIAADDSSTSKHTPLNPAPRMDGVWEPKLFSISTLSTPFLLPPPSERYLAVPASDPAGGPACSALSTVLQPENAMPMVVPEGPSGSVQLNE